MKFINRQQEMARLDRLARQPKAAVAVVWGRRRVGKTRLLLEWVHKHRGIYYTADESSSTIQRKYFAIAVAQALGGFDEVDYPDWAALFLRLARDAERAGWRGPIVIDELPYLIALSPELPSVLQKFIDHEAKKAKLLIALCGSSQRMMQGAILDSSAPLYGRADEIMKLGPIAVGYMKEALRIKRPRDVVEAYAVWGGIPRYWELVEKSEGTFLEIVERLALDPMGPLHEEPHRLLLEETPSAIHLRPILDAIGLGAHRLSEVAGRMGQPVTALMRAIQRLIELDLIQREVPYGMDTAHSKKTLYKIKDPFVRFWFEVIASRRSALAQVSSAVRMQWLKEATAHVFASAWEELCRVAVPMLSKKLGEQYGEAGRFWHSDGAEWDIVSTSHKGSHILIGEAKWTAKTPSAKWVYQAIRELQGKGFPPITRPANAEWFHVLFIPETPKGLALPPGVQVIDAKAVIEALR